MVGNIQRYSLQDGPGIRTTVFLKGCPLMCWWCHNPEARSAQTEILVQETRCIRCGECARHCPEGAAAPGEPAPNGVCTRCGACVAVCPSGARSAVGVPMSVEAVLTELEKDTVFYEESGGGATFSGGEPLMQPDFLKDLLAACRARGFHTAVDTCGFAPVDELLKVAASTDLFLYDLKFIDDERHRLYTGVSNGPILANLRTLSERHGEIWLRIPLIPGVNDGDGELDGMAHLAKSLPGVRQVNLIPYHRTGIAKFRRLGRDYTLESLVPPTAQQMESAAAHFTALGLHTRSGG
jgi:pyruvate formate lyase activating enzyme